MPICLSPPSRTTGLKGSGCLKGFLVPRFLCVDSGMMLRSAFQDSTNAELPAPIVKDYWAQGVGMLERVSSAAVSACGFGDDVKICISGFHQCGVACPHRRGLLGSRGRDA